jgi:hydrogenase maturation protease
MGVAEAVELARALGELPTSLVVYGVRGGRFDHATELSPEVDAACDEVVGRVLEDIRALLKSRD